MIAHSHSCAKQHHWDSIVLLKLLQFQCQINWKHFNEFPVVLSLAIMISLSWPDTGHWICSNVADNQWSLLHHSVSDQWGVWVNCDLNQSQGEKVSTLVADISEWCSTIQHWGKIAWPWNMKYYVTLVIWTLASVLSYLMSESCPRTGVCPKFLQSRLSLVVCTPRVGPG